MELSVSKKIHYPLKSSIYGLKLEKLNKLTV